MNYWHLNSKRNFGICGNRAEWCETPHLNVSVNHAKVWKEWHIAAFDDARYPCADAYPPASRSPVLKHDVPIFLL